ncbi:zinc finger protein 862-like [Ptychodera flava]|uniref:zinc finger protein 862-like n=1 Tax=Ptychodera flava TaxID=63121 RepID=UPI003969E25C
MQSVARANAPGIYKALMKSLVFENISLQQMQQKIVGFGCDGASVNTGSVSGVITLLQTNISKEIVLVKCLAHRLELAFKDAIKGIHLYTKLNTLLTELFKFYHTSSLQTENLKQTFRALGLQTALPHRVGGTRWVSHVLGALIQVWKGYAAYVKHLGQVASEHSNKKQPKAKHLSMLLSSKELVVFGNFLTDVLTVISTLSQQLQRDETGIYHSHEQIQATIMVVKKYKEREGPYLRSVFEKEEYKGYTLKGTVNFESVRIKVVDAMVGCLEKRFSDIDIGLLAATKLANFSTWPTVFNESNKDFGDEHVATLTDHFSQTLQQQGVNPAVVELEWNILRSSLYNNHTVADLTWPAVNKILGNECKNILALVDLVLSLPASSAVCERGFSLMKQTKTEYRNRLHTKTLSNLLMVKLHTKNEKEYDPTSAIHYWNTGGPKKRRHNFMEDRSNQLSDSSNQAGSSDQAVLVEEQDETGVAIADKDKMLSDSDSDWSDYGSCSEMEEEDDVLTLEAACEDLGFED